MHRFLWLKFIFSSHALRVSDYISPSSGATFIGCTSHLVYSDTSGCCVVIGKTAGLITEVCASCWFMYICDLVSCCVACYESKFLCHTEVQTNFGYFFSSSVPFIYILLIWYAFWKNSLRGLCVIVRSHVWQIRMYEIHS